MRQIKNIRVLLSVMGFLLLSGCGTAGSTTSVSTSPANRAPIVPATPSCTSSPGGLSKCEVPRIEKQAEAGDSEAQFQMGDWYRSPRGKRNYIVAVKWYRQAANQGHREAQYQIANMYYWGYGVAKDRDEGEKWYRKATEQGHAIAARTLGEIYYWGRYKPKDLEEAEKWYREAVRLGDTASESRLDRVIMEQDPARILKQEEEKRKRKEKERLEAEAEREKERKQREQEVSIRAIQAKARFGTIKLTVAEAVETNRLRVNLDADKLGKLKDGTTDSVGNVADLMSSGMGTLIWLGPVGAGVGAVIGLIAGISDETDKAKARKLRPEEEAAMLRVIALLAKEEVENNFQTQLLALSDQQRAGHLLVPSPPEDRPPMPFYLNISMQEIGFFRTPENPRNGRLWVAVDTNLVNADNDRNPMHQRICYATYHSQPLISWGAENGQVFREELNMAYRYIADQILTRMVGLAPDPDTIQTWQHTVQTCMVEANGKGADKFGKRKALVKEGETILFRAGVSNVAGSYWRGDFIATDNEMYLYREKNGHKNLYGRWMYSDAPSVKIESAGFQGLFRNLRIEGIRFVVSGGRNQTAYNVIQDQLAKHGIETAETRAPSELDSKETYSFSRDEKILFDKKIAWTSWAGCKGYEGPQKANLVITNRGIYHFSKNKEQRKWNYTDPPKVRLDKGPSGWRCLKIDDRGYPMYSGGKKAYNVIIEQVSKQ